MICSEWTLLTHVWIFWKYTFRFCSKKKDLPNLWLHACVCLCICVHTYVQQSLLSTVFFHTMTAHSNPIKATQRASQHHSFICHSFSLALPFPRLLVEGLGGNWVGELYHFLVLSLSFPFILPVVIWHLGVNMFYLAWSQDVYLTGQLPFLFMDLCLSYMLWCNTLVWALYLL